MKTMTCKDLGGPCDQAFHGNTADEIIKAQDAHLKEMVAKSDEGHIASQQEMQARRKNPLKGMGWYLSIKKAFSKLAED